MKYSELINEINNYSDEAYSFSTDTLLLDMTKYDLETAIPPEALSNLLGLLEEIAKCNHTDCNTLKHKTVPEILTIIHNDKKYAKVFGIPLGSYKMGKCIMLMEILSNMAKRHPEFSNLMNISLTEYAENAKYCMPEKHHLEFMNNINEATKIIKEEFKFGVSQEIMISEIMHMGWNTLHNCAFYYLALKMAKVLELLFFETSKFSFKYKE